MRNMTKEWLKSIEQDLKTIEEIIHNDFLTGIVAFHSQQAIEKSFKALLEENEIKIDKTHNLNKLFYKINELIPLEIDRNILKILDDLYIDSRYPGELGILPNGKPTIEEAKDFYEFALNIFKSIEKYLQLSNKK